MKPEDDISFLDICLQEGANLQRRMNFRLGGNYNVILMSLEFNPCW
jgi:hypothetical protein